MKKIVPMVVAFILWMLAENAMALFQVPYMHDFGTV